MSKKVVVGMSGGVDSSVAAYLLKKQGYDVIGATIQTWFDIEDKNSSTIENTIEDAKKVCEKLDIPFHVIDLREEFKKEVIDYFVNEYMSGKTPNPCVQCNKTVKFGAFLEKARELGADYLATGHYARIVEKNGRYLIKKAVDDTKDQTYMLYKLSQEQLSHILMPCGEYKKSEIREIANEIGLEIHSKKDSQEVCFIPDNNHGEYIKKIKKGKIKEGYFIDKNGKILGKHKGIMNYTIGQRKGLGIALGKPVFVTKIIASKNAVILGEEEEIFKNELIAKEVNFIAFDKLDYELRVKAKVRYSAKPAEASIIPIGENTVKVVFKDKQRAITKGQSVVFYLEDYVIGGGIIDRVL